MPRIGEDRAVLHLRDMFSANDLSVPRQRQEHIPERRRLLHGFHFAAVHQRLERAMRIKLRHDDAGSKRLRPQSDAAPAPAVPGDHDDLPRNEHIRGSHDAVPDGLSGSIPVVEEILALGVVDGDHRKCEDAVLRHRFQAFDAGRRFLGTAENLRKLLPVVRVDRRDKIRAVVDDDVEVVSQYGVKVPEVFVRRHPVAAENLHSVLAKRLADVVLRGKGIASGRDDRRAELAKRFEKTRRFRFEVKTRADAVALEGLFVLIPGEKALKHRHELPRPLDLVPPPFCEFRIDRHFFRHIHHQSFHRKIRDLSYHRTRKARRKKAVSRRRVR